MELGRTCILAPSRCLFLRLRQIARSEPDGRERIGLDLQRHFPWAKSLKDRKGNTSKSSVEVTGDLKNDQLLRINN